MSAEFSPDGTRVLIVSGDNIQIRRADGKGKPVVLDCIRECAYARFSPDGTRVLIVSYDTVQIWRADGKGKPVVAFR